MDNYFVYLRKSTEEEDKQIQSIESQKEELLEKVIKPRNISVLHWYWESKSAKMPGRPVFNEMIERIKAGEANHVIVWHINRLARNLKDGGDIMWLVEQGKMKIVTPTRVYDSEEIVNFTHEFGQSAKFSHDLSRDVTRGLYNKVKKGMAPIHAPIGYYNDRYLPKGLKDIKVDKERFPLVKRMFDMLLTGNYTPWSILKIATNEWGLRKKDGQPIRENKIYEIFRNPFYCGQFIYHNQLYEGTHTPMITKVEFEQAQEILNARGRKRITKRELSYTGILSCPCGCAITGEERYRLICPKCHTKFNAEKHEICPKCELDKEEMNIPLHVYRYYHCTRKKDKNCTQPATTEKDLEDQIKTLLLTLYIPKDFVEWAKKYMEFVTKSEIKSKVETEESLNQTIINAKKKQVNLKNKFMSLANINNELMTNEEYILDKKKIEDEISQLGKRLTTVDNKIEEANVQTNKTFNFAHRCRYWLENGTHEEKRTIVATLGSNLILNKKLLRLDLLKPFEYARQISGELLHSDYQFEPINESDTLTLSASPFLQFPLLCPEGELNPHALAGTCS
ncbi:hypothetical protein B6D29_00785 [Microgenomates bacterium UTCPR1]|nr:MAG: hypothetical protein B6D29_00785 [Microgenomates bacterium UTCPR1]